MIDLMELIEGPNDGHTSASLLSPGYAGYGATVPAIAPIADYVGETSGSIRTQPDDGSYPAPTLDEMIDGQVDGSTGPSLDGFTGVSYAGKPGYGIANDQLGQSAETSTAAGWTVPSEEVGVGRSPGWRWAHYPHVEQHNPRREAYADQGYFADGMGYVAQGQELTDEAAGNVRPPVWQQAFDNPGQDPDQRYLAPGSGIIEQPAGMSLSQILGALGAPGWGVS